MSVELWLSLQEQLWEAFGPLTFWCLVFLLAGFVAAAVFMFGAVFFAEWMSG